jgi:F-type H+-transporting ATPase subunit b
MNVRYAKRNLRWAAFAVLVMLLLAGVPAAMASSEGGHGKAGGHGAPATKGWIATDTYRVMNFAVLAIGLFFLLRKPLSEALGGRIKGIREQLADLEQRKAQAEKELAACTQRLATLGDESQRIVAEYVKQGEEAKARILREAEAAAAKLEEQAKRNIAHEFQQARLRLQREVMEQAIGRAEALVREKITADDQNRLVGDYLQKVVAQ